MLVLEQAPVSEQVPVLELEWLEQTAMKRPLKYIDRMSLYNPPSHLPFLFCTNSC